MAIWDEKWRRTKEAEELAHKVEDALKPVFDWCVKNNISFEDFHYSVCTEAQELILLAVIGGQSQFNKPVKKMAFPLADNVSVGSVVITKDCLDVGLVAEVFQGKPKKILSRYNEFHDSNDECPQYGNVKGIDWFDTGVRMSLQEWIDLSRDTKDAEGFYKYWWKKFDWRH